MSTTQRNRPEHRLAPAAWPLLLAVALMLVIGIAAVQLVSWTRGYSGGLAMWIAAEQEAAAQLRSYAASGNEIHYQRFRREIAVNVADHLALVELQKPDGDDALAYQHFLDGKIPQHEVAGLIRLLTWLGSHPSVQRAAKVWGDADVMVLELVEVGEDMHAEFAGGAPDRQRVAQLSAHADRLHERIQPLAVEFGRAMSEAAQQIVGVVNIVLPLIAGVLVLLGLLLFKALDRRAARAMLALRELSARLEHQATHDSLTGLANRAQFESELAHELTRERAGAEAATLLYFDLDQFKVVNDTCGHAAGDELLRQVAWRVQRRAGEGATLGRLGGDEFGLLLRGLSIEPAVRLANSIREELSAQRFFWNGRTFMVSASIGVLELGADVSSVADALAAADHACYVAKDSGRNRVHVHCRDDHETQKRLGEAEWIERLNAALEGEGLALVAQEIQSVAFARRPGRPDPHSSRRFEVLLRLVGGNGELVAPMAFIPAAERYGLMPRIDRWVIARACRELAAWRARGMAVPTCLINLSRASVADKTLADYIVECLHQYSLPGSCLGFEVTEAVAVGNIAASSELMARLRKVGCMIALDDFGTGMSSFSYLRSLPIDLLKIDRGFARAIGSDPIDHALVETIQRVASIMGVRTVAEGVEDAETLAAVALIGVDFAQGAHLSLPLPLAQVLQPEPGIAILSHRSAATS